MKALPAPERGNVIEYDTETTGFGIRVTAAAARSFVVNYRRKVDGRERGLTISSFPDWSVTAAREQAKRLKRDVDAGSDPVGENRAEREAPTLPTFALGSSMSTSPSSRRGRGAIANS